MRCALSIAVLVLALGHLPASSQEPAAAPPIAAPPAGDRDLVEYAGFLRGEAEAHRGYLEGLTDRAIWLFGSIGAGALGLLGFLNWRSREEIEKAVEARFDAAIRARVDDRLKSLEAELNERVGAARGEFERELERLREEARDFQRNLAGLYAEERSDAGKSPRVTRGGEALSLSPSERMPLSGRRILWVDDHPRNNDFPSEVLRNRGAEIVAVRSTADALAKLDEAAFDLVLTDMARGDDPTAGVDLLRRLGERERRPKVIVFCSTRGIDRYGRAAQEAGAFAVTSGYSSLFAAVDRALGG